MKEQLDIIKQFQDFSVWDTCPLSLSDPQRIFSIMEDVGRERPFDAKPKRIYLGVKLCDGNAELIEQYNVKKRMYIGTTTMDAELSLLVANQALARPGSLIYDPFAGTGSLMISCSHFGAVTVGADIDKRILNGNGLDNNVFSNFKQYGISNKLLDFVVVDHAHPVWKMDNMLDAIVCDPPYGVREGARKIGKKRKTLEREKSHPKPPDINSSKHIPQCVAYTVPEILQDLLQFAAFMLRLEGRLVYWFPTTDQYKETDLPLHPCLKIVANSEQPLSSRWRRRLITMVKTQNYIKGVHDLELVSNALIPY